MNTSPKAFRVANYVALILSVAGLVLVCLPIIGLAYTIQFATSWYPQIIVGYAVMILAIEVAGVPLRAELTRFWKAGIYSYALFIVGVTGASATSMVVYQDYDPSSYIIKPLFWLGMYGLIPALIIGFIGAAVLRYLSQKTGEKAAS